MRRKVYGRTRILDGAYEVAVTEGFGEITARKVAEKTGMSIQPIYLNFEDMDALRQALLHAIFDEIRKNYFSLNQTIVEFALNYYRFSTTQKALCQSLLTDSLATQPFQKALFGMFLSVVKGGTTLTFLEMQIIFARIVGTIASLVNIMEEEVSQATVKKILASTVLNDIENLQEQVWRE